MKQDFKKELNELLCNLQDSGGEIGIGDRLKTFHEIQDKIIEIIEIEKEEAFEKGKRVKSFSFIKYSC